MVNLAHEVFDSAELTATSPLAQLAFLVSAHCLISRSRSNTNA